MVVSSFAVSPSKEEEVPALLNALGKLWLAGVAVDWAGFHKNGRRLHVALPTYPFERKRFWIEPLGTFSAHQLLDDALEDARGVSGSRSMGAAALSSTPTPATRAAETDGVPGIGSSGSAVPRKTRILAALTTQFQELSSANLTELGPTASFMEMGLDSLFLVQVCVAIEKRFGIRITFPQLMEEMTTLNELADFLDRTLSMDTQRAAAPHTPDAIQAELQAMEHESTAAPLAAPILELIPRAPRKRQPSSSASRDNDATRTGHQTEQVTQ